MFVIEAKLVFKENMFESNQDAFSLKAFNSKLFPKQTLVKLSYLQREAKEQVFMNYYFPFDYKYFLS